MSKWTHEDIKVNTKEGHHSIVVDTEIDIVIEGS
jgi:hypothetical protein